MQPRFRKWDYCVYWCGICRLNMFLVVFAIDGETSANLSKSLEAVISPLSSRKWASTASRSCSKTIRETALISGVWETLLCENQFACLFYSRHLFIILSCVGGHLQLEVAYIVLGGGGKMLYDFYWMNGWVLNSNSAVAWEHSIVSRPPSQLCCFQILHTVSDKICDRSLRIGCTRTHTHTHMQFLQLSHLSADGPSTLLILLLQCFKSQLSFLCALLVLLSLMLKLLPEFVQHCLPLGTQCMCVLQVLGMCMKRFEEKERKLLHTQDLFTALVQRYVLHMH